MTLSKREQELIKHYDGKLEYYSPAGDDLEDIMDQVMAPNTKGGRMLDIGCGDGRACVYAVKNEMKYVGVDYSEARIKKAQETYPSELCTFLHADIYEWLPTLNKQFDLIFCCELLEHLEKPEVIWEHMKRLCGPAGVVVCTCPVNMPHKAHLQVIKNPTELRERFPDIYELSFISCRTPGGKQRKHFLFTYEPC